MFAEGTTEDPAEGAHGGFIELAAEVAEDTETFSSSDSPSDMREFLAPR